MRASAVEPSTWPASLWPTPPKGSLSVRSASQVRFVLMFVSSEGWRLCLSIVRVEVHASSDRPFTSAGVHTCFVCKKRGEDVRRCMIPVCGKFYHGECITNHAPTAPVNRGFRCSIHVCLTCFIANPNSSSISKGSWSRKPLCSRPQVCGCSCEPSGVCLQAAWCDACAAQWPIMPQTCAWRRAALCSPATASSAPTISPLAGGSRTTNTSTSAGALSAQKVLPSPTTVL